MQFSIIPYRGGYLLRDATMESFHSTLAAAVAERNNLELLLGTPLRSFEREAA